MNYNPCEGCGHVWTTSKYGGAIVRHVTLVDQKADSLGATYRPSPNSMRASADETWLVLKQWHENRTPLLVFLATDDAFAATFRSVILGLSDNEILLLSKDRLLARVLFDGAKLEYMHPSEIPSLRELSLNLGETALSIRRKDGSWCCLIPSPS